MEVEEEQDALCPFDVVPDSIILKMLFYLSPIDIAHFGMVSSRFNLIAEDDLLWKYIFNQYFRIPQNLRRPLVHSKWKDEFLRLVDETPIVETETLKAHTDQILHVAFSNDGSLFSTCSKDANVVVWNSLYPAKQVARINMKEFCWKYTQFSQFNESDTLLLISGVLFGLNSSSGDIAIFSVGEEFNLQCRTTCKPYDIFGTWYSDMLFLSGDLDWLGNMVNRSLIWMNKASQESQSEHASVRNGLFRFYNPNSSSIRSILIANCVDGNERVEGIKTKQEATKDEPAKSQPSKCRPGNPPSSLRSNWDTNLITVNSRGLRATIQGAFQNWKPLDNIADITYSSEFHSRNCLASSSEGSSSWENMSPVNEAGNSEIEDIEPKCSPSKKADSIDKPSLSDSNTRSDGSTPASGSSSIDLLDDRDKWLIFTCGSKTFSPHQIGFKRIKSLKFNEKIDLGLSLKERIEEQKRINEARRNGSYMYREPDWSDYDTVATHFDEIDVKLELHGHIIGMTLSPDHQYLYVNSRPWPENYEISDPLEPPPIAQEIDIHVIDMSTLRQVGLMKRAHRAYTANSECFFIFLDACLLYLASGAEDKAGYLWDRSYGISLAKFPHTDVVNCVAFNPACQEMLVTVSDDMSIKIWRSMRLARKLKLNPQNLPQGVRLYEKNKTLFHKKRC